MTGIGVFIHVSHLEAIVCILNLKMFYHVHEEVSSHNTLMHNYAMGSACAPTSTRIFRLLHHRGNITAARARLRCKLH